MSSGVIPARGTLGVAAALVEWALNFFMSIPDSSITNFNHLAMKQDFTTWCGDTKLRSKWDFLSLDSLWLAVIISML